MARKTLVPIKLVGIAEDLPPQEVGDMWTAGINFFSRDGGMRRFDGFDLYAEATWPSGVQPLFILPVELPLQTFWMYAGEVVGTGAVVIYVTNGADHFDITPTVAPTDARLGYWTGTILNGVPVLNNGVDPPWYWNGDTAAVCLPLPDWPAGQTARSIRAYKYHLFALGVYRDNTSYPDLVVWSDGAEPGLIPAGWTPGPGNDAGEVTLGDTQGGVIDAGKIRDALAIYKNYSTTICSYVGGNFVFAFRGSPSISTGAQSQNCIAESQGQAYVFTGDDVIVHDGNQARSICTDEVRKAIVGRIDPERYQQTVVTARHLTDEVWICLPVLDAAYLTLAYVYNTKTRRWGKRSLPGVTHLDFGLVGDEDALISWDAQVDDWNTIERRWDEAFYSESANEILMSDYTGQRLLIVDRLQNNAGVAITAELSREGLPVGDMGRVKYINELWPQIYGEEGQVIDIRVGGQINYSDPVQWSSSMQYEIGQDPAKVDPHVMGRFFSFQFSATGGRTWSVYDIEARISDKGRF